MAAGRRLLGRAILAWVVGALGLRGAAQEPASEPRATTPLTTDRVEELPAEVRAALSSAEDFTLNFDQSGFYAVLDFVRDSPRSPGYAGSPVAVTDWRAFLERPGSLRGQPVTISGTVGANKDPYRLADRDQPGLVSQLELFREDQPLTVTLILTQPAPDIPLGALVEATGYFVLVRRYYGASRQLHEGAVVIAPGPSSVARTVSRPPAGGALDWRWPLAGVLGGLVLAWLLLRRAARGTRPDPSSLRARRDAPLHLAEDLERWADDEGRPPQ